MSPEAPTQVPLEPLEIKGPAERGPEGPKPGPLARLKARLTGWSTPETMGHVGGTSEQLAAVRTDLAVQRTVMGADRTLMAWIRTSLSLNSFGFTIYKVLQGFLQGGAVLPKDSTPRNVGLFLTFLGAFAMVMGTIEYWGVLRQLRQSAWRTPMIMAVIMSIMSLVLFFGIIAKAL